MGKEVKIGLTIVALLLVIFGYVLFRRIAGSQQPSPEVAAKAELTPESKASGPAKPASGQPAASTTPSGDSGSPALAIAAGSGLNERAGGALGDRYSSAAVTGASTGQEAASAAAGDLSPPGRYSRYNVYGEPSDAGPNQTGSTGGGAAQADASQTIEEAERPESAASEDDPPGTTEEPTAGLAGERSTTGSHSLASRDPERDPHSSADGASAARDLSHSSGSASSSTEPLSAGQRYTSPETVGGGSQFSGAGGAGLESSPQQPQAAGQPSPGNASSPALGGSPGYRHTPPSSFTEPGGFREAGSTAPLRSQSPSYGGQDSYVVELNDNYWRVAEKVYGTGAYFKALHEHNRDRHPRPDRLRPGDVLRTPSPEALRQAYPDLCPRAEPAPPRPAMTLASSVRAAAGGRVYVVEEGDTLFDIARYELGKATRWTEIYELNQHAIGENVHHLRPGTELILPNDGRPDSVTRRPGATLER